MNVFQFYPCGDEAPEVSVQAYLIEKDSQLPLAARGAVLICPGGGYAMVSHREGEPVARQFLAAGRHAFVLNYSVEERAAGFRPLQEVYRTLSVIAAHADEWDLDPADIAVCGFSAGGHLAACAATFWDDPARNRFGAPRPSCAVLGYPVITGLGPCAHQGSFKRIVSGEQPDETQLEALSPEFGVRASTPPAFIFHTADDEAVPVMNSLLYAQSLAGAGVPFELHIFPHGPHGLSISQKETGLGLEAYENADVAQWVPLAVRFMRQLRERREE